MQNVPHTIKVFLSLVNFRLQATNKNFGINISCAIICKKIPVEMRTELPSKTSIVKHHCMLLSCHVRVSE